MTVDTSLLSGESPSSVLDRAALLLGVFDEETALTLSEIVDRTGLPRSSIHRMLNQMVMLQWLRRSDRNYQLGYRFVELGSLVLQQDLLHRTALPLMHELHRITGMVVHLGILDGSDVVYIEKVGGILGKTVPTRVGGRLPARSSAIGRAMLAFTNTDRERGHLTPTLARIQESGISMESGEALPGFSCIAAPIGPKGKPVAAMSICGPRSRVRLDHRAAGPVRMAAAAVWQTMNQNHSISSRRRTTALQVLPSSTVLNA